jgi:hypothetical protein
MADYGTTVKRGLRSRRSGFVVRCRESSWIIQGIGRPGESRPDRHRRHVLGEAKTERIAHELMNLNRKINALEKVIIPRFQHLIRHMEDSLFDEDLEDFNRIRHIRDFLEKRKI